MILLWVEGDYPGDARIFLDSRPGHRLIVLPMIGTVGDWKMGFKSTWLGFFFLSKGYEQVIVVVCGHVFVG